MRRNKIRVFVHLVWTTWDRQPLLTPAIERRVYRVIESEIQSLHCQVLAIGGDASHMHLLVDIAATVAISTLVQQAKGVSSRFINAALQPTVPFRWQGCYGAFSLGAGEVPEVIAYLQHQKPHHATQRLRADLEHANEEDTGARTAG